MWFILDQGVGVPVTDLDRAQAFCEAVLAGQGELRYLAISSQDLPEICDYPDSGKFGIFDAPTPGAAAAAAPPFRFISRPGQQLDYWDGE